MMFNQLLSVEEHTLDHRPIWIFGAGKFGRDLCIILKDSGFNVLGFVESTARKDKVLGLPVLNINQVGIDNSNMQLAVGIFSREIPFDNIAAQATAAGFQNIFMPWDLYRQFEDQLGWRYWLSCPSTLTDNISNLEKVYNMLSDELSKQHLLDICLFRLGLKNNYSNVIDNCPQYFNELTLSNKDIRYIDGGAYNGDSYKHLLNVANVTDAYLFEPDQKNYNLLVENIKSALCIPLALSDNYRILSFNADNGEGSSISSQGSSHIAATSIDNIIGNKLINFIKLDVEGAEVDAINGAKNVIKNNRPILAISLYHKPQDLWEIPFALLDTCNNYSFYIRQHYYNSFDSVLYAVPL